MAQLPLCFVLMPFGKKAAGGTQPIDFDAVYRDLIAPAVIGAGMEPLRADEEDAGGIIHKPMFERLVLCEYAVADLTAANANVFYELGVRHAAKPRSTALLFAEGHGRLPFDVAQLRALPYKIGRNGKVIEVAEAVQQLTDKLNSAKTGTDTDSPLYQLLDDYPNIAHEKTDVFRERVLYANEIKKQLAQARGLGLAAIKDVEKSLGSLNDQEAGVIIDLYLSYRAVKAWGEMIRLQGEMNPIIAATVLVQEQYALALNRDGQSETAETVLKLLIKERGPSSETLGILGRVYKNRWQSAKAAGETFKAKGLLRQVISTYRQGFEADWRDAYPGVNALTHMQIADPKGTDYEELRPVVGYAVQRKIESGEVDYWDYATLLELAILDRDQDAANLALSDALGRQREKWEPETTAQNIRLLIEARNDTDPDNAGVAEIEKELLNASS